MHSIHRHEMAPHMRATADAVLEANIDQFGQERRDCPFCGFNLSTSRDPHDTVLATGPGVKLLPALGMLVTGHVLVITDEHVLSMADLGESNLARISTWISRVEEVLARRFGRCIRFERAGSADGCSSACIDHAHVHLLPVEDTLTQKIEAALHWVPLPKFEALHEYANRGYAYLGTGDRNFIYSGYLESQWIRRRVGDFLGRDDWDWCLTRDQAELDATLDSLQASQFD